MEIFDNNIDPESEVGRIIQENEFAEGGKIDAKNYRIQELNVIRDLIRRQRKKYRRCKVRKFCKKISQINNYYRLKY